jgi:HK97 family phage portal protein
MPAPGSGGSQTSLAGMVSWLTSRFRGQPQQKKGAPIASYTMGNDPTGLSGNARGDISQFAPVFQPTAGMFSPNYPLVPTDRQNVRLWNYPTAWNTNYRPRSYEPIGFEELRALASGHDITRLAIETRKDQIESQQFQVKPRDPKKEADSRCDEIEDFFRKPDGIRPFATWIRELLDDVLVIDAPALEVRRNRANEIIGLDQVDGSTIKVLLDETGRRPRPPAPAYEQVIHGRPWVLLEDGSRANTDEGDVVNQFNDGQLIYLPRNPRIYKGYGFSPIEQIYTTINIGLRRQAKQLLHFTDGNIPPGLLNSPEGWSPQQIAEYAEWFNSILAGNLQNQTRLIWGPFGAKYQPFTEPPYKDEFDEWLARIVCYAFSLPPSAFTHQVNRATAQTAQEVALEEGLAPIMAWVKRLCDGVIQDLMGYADLEFAWAEKRDLDPAEQATILDTYVRNGSYTLNEARDVLGMDPVEGGDDPMIYLPTGPVLLSDVAAISDNMANPPPPPPIGAGMGGGGAPGKGPAKPKGKPAPTGKAPAKSAKVQGVAKAGTDPFGDPASRRYLATARDGIARSIEVFFKGEAPRVARDVLARKTTAKYNSNYNSNYNSKASDHTDPEQHGVTPAADAHRNRQLSAAAAAAIAGIDFARWNDIVGEIAPHLEDTATQTISDTLAAVHAELTDAQVEAAKAEARKWARDRAAELVGRSHVGGRTIPDTTADLDITDSTARMIAENVRQAIAQKSTVEELTGVLQNTYAFSPTRARAIADYETKSALHDATMRAFKASNRVKGSYWNTVADLKVEATCLLNEAASPVRLGHLFPSGHAAPLAHNGCRCWLTPWMAD